MFDTFVAGFKLKTTYDTNKLISWFQRFPLIGKHIPDSLYKVEAFVVLKMIISIFQGIFKVFFPVFFYMLCMIAVPSFVAYGREPQAFLHLMVILSFVGTMTNAELFNYSIYKYNGIVMLRMNAREYALSDFLLFLLKKIVGFLLWLTVAAVVFKVSPLYILLILLMIILGKFFGAKVEMHFARKNCKASYVTVRSIIGFVFLVAAYLTFAAKIFIPSYVCLIICLVSVTLGIISIPHLFKSNDYDKIYKYIFKEQEDVMDKQAKALIDKRNTTANILSDNTKEITSEKSGYAYFHELFVKRHKKILGKRTLYLSLFILAVIVIATFVLVGARINGKSYKFPKTVLLFSLPFVMYLVNIGESFTLAMFSNCDIAMLNFNFYRSPSVILGMFKQRLKTVVVLNIIPALLISAFLVELTAFSKSSHEYMTYIYMPLAVLALSVFFSVHRLVIYYLLQPLLLHYLNLNF